MLDDNIHVSNQVNSRKSCGSGCRYSMLRMALAPCAPFNVTAGLMVKAARLARQYVGVRLHTHLAENQEDIDFSQKEYKCRPGAYIK